MNYTKSNLSEAKGTTFKFIDDDIELIGGDSYGKEYDALIAAVDDNIGFTIKDINDDNPKHFLFCLDIHAAGLQTGVKLAKSRAMLADNVSIISELSRVKGFVRFSEFARCAAGGWDDNGGGSCPF